MYITIQLWNNSLNDIIYAFNLAPTLRALKLSSTTTKDRSNARRKMKLKENRQRPTESQVSVSPFFFFFSWKKLKRNIYKRRYFFFFSFFFRERNWNEKKYLQKTFLFFFFLKGTCLPVSLQRLLSLESAERGIRGNMLPVLSKFTREDFRSPLRTLVSENIQESTLK